MMIEKRCSRCERLLPLVAFAADKRLKDGLRAHCRECAAAMSRRYREADLERYRAKNREWDQAHAEKRKLDTRRWRERLRDEVIVGYGGACQCCGERTREFLAIDHVNGGGREDRRVRFKGNVGTFYRWLKVNGFPRGGYRLLCHNCNSALGYYGYCPHQRLTA